MDIQNMEKESEFYGCLIDIVEDFLDSKNVTIDNPEREEDNSAIIYGSDYDELKNAFKSVIKAWTPEEKISNERLIVLFQNALSVIRDEIAAGNLQDYCLIELGMTKEEYNILSENL